MKKWLHESLICPGCLPRQIPLDLSIREVRDDDVIEGQMHCAACKTVYAIRKGVAILLAGGREQTATDTSGYNSPGMLSAYLWSHYSDLLGDPEATTAYQRWASLLNPSDGLALDIGCAVGRLSFEMSAVNRRVIGIDTSFSFIAQARKLLRQRQLRFDLIVEGLLTEERSCDLRHDWKCERIDFLVADALALPFPDTLFSTVSSINILEKVPDPLQHLREMNRVLARNNGRLVFSDPFSWDASVTDPDLWIGGRADGPFPGRGIDGVRRIFTGGNGIFQPPLAIMASGTVSWKIRKTENLREHITSQFLAGSR